MPHKNTPEVVRREVRGIFATEAEAEELRRHAQLMKEVAEFAAHSKNWNGLVTSEESNVNPK